MSDTDGQSFERTKLRKQLTQRKRGKEPRAAASSAPEETKSVNSSSTTKSSKGKPWLFQGYLKKWVPSYLQQRPTAKIAFDVAFFTVSAVVIIKLGQ